jgi:hypothetical protein
MEKFIRANGFLMLSDFDVTATADELASFLRNWCCSTVGLILVLSM